MIKSPDPDLVEHSDPPSYNEIYNISQDEIHRGSRSAPSCSHTRKPSEFDGIETLDAEGSGNEG